jgi:glycosyltransferase involved in cell wall biosynthesis
MEFKPFFSVVISTKNRATLVLKAIESVFNQTFQTFELIVVDNASTDNTQHELSKIKDVRFTYLRNDIDRERCFARNRGIRASKGEYICFLDSDDAYLENHLQVIYDDIQRNKTIGLYFTNAFETYNFSDRIKRVCPDLEKYNLFHYILTYTFNPARVAVHNSIVKKHQYDEKIPGLEDLDLWLLIATEFPVFQIKARTILYNIHDESYSMNSHSRFLKELKMFRYVFNKPELINCLPTKSKNRLLSMCYYKLSVSYSQNFKPFFIHYLILKAYFLCKEGYNKNANRTMIVIFIDQIPLIGYLFKKTRRIGKFKNS